jgi:hypothetical protein
VQLRFTRHQTPASSTTQAEQDEHTTEQALPPPPPPPPPPPLFATATAVVGCDGIFSRVRHQLPALAARCPLQYLGVMVMLGIFPSADRERFALCQQVCGCLVSGSRSASRFGATPPAGSTQRLAPSGPGHLRSCSSVVLWACVIPRSCGCGAGVLW